MEPPPAPSEYRPSLVLNRIIGELGALILHRECRCGHSSCTPIWHIVERYGGRHLLGDILPRLVCGRCRQHPTVILSDSMHTKFLGGPPPGWSVMLAESSHTAIT